MTDKNYLPYSKNFYNEINDEIEKLSRTDVELIRIHLQCLKNAINQYTEQIENLLVRIEIRNHLEKK